MDAPRTHPRSTTMDRVRPVLVASLIASLGLALLVWAVPAEPLTGDGGSYVRYVESHFERGANAPWHERRFLGLRIVSALPFGTLVGFHVLTVASLFAIALLTWAAARGLGEPPARALAAMGLLFGTWAVAPNVREYALIDAFAWAFAAAVWLALVHRRWRTAAIVGAVGMAAKEMVGAVVLAAAVGAWADSRGWAGARGALGVLLPATILEGALFFLPLASPIGVGGYVSNWVADGLGSLGPARVGYFVFISLGALWILLPRGIVLLPQYLRFATLALAVLGLAMPVLGTPERMAIIAFPAMITAALAATPAWGAGRTWALGLAATIVVARLGGSAPIPTFVTWLSFAVASGLALSAYAPLVASVRTRLGLRPAALPSSGPTTP